MNLQVNFHQNDSDVSSELLQVNDRDPTETSPLGMEGGGGRREYSDCSLASGPL
jgi:hypothetical protein